MKTALITGASGGIGSALVKKIIDDGYFVLGQYNNGEDRISALISELKETGRADYFASVKADLKTSDGINAVKSAAVKNFGHIDLLINNAGADLYKLSTETSESEFDDIISVNLKSAYLLTAFAFDQMIKRQKGRVIFISSIWGVTGGAMESAYSASKSALIGLTKSLAKEVGYSNITVNCVCPGVIDTAMNKRFNKEEMDELVNNTPLNRLGTPNDVSELVSFLASDKASFITGQIITADGGFTL